jgi:hypothetical protein
MVHHSVNDPVHNAQFVVVTKIDGRLTVEAMIGPGPENVLIFKGTEAKDYLRKVGIDH